MAPAKTGKDNRSKTAVTRTDHTNNGTRFQRIPGHLMLMMVTIKFIAPAIDDTPAKCKLKMAKSTEYPECASPALNGGYTVQPVPTPASTKLDVSSKVNEGGNNQNDMLLSLGNAMSGLPIKIGTNQFP